LYGFIAAIGTQPRAAHFRFASPMELSKKGDADRRTLDHAALSSADPLSTGGQAHLGLDPRSQRQLGFREKYFGSKPGRNLQNPQVSFFAPCCEKWFDSVKRHNEMQGHPFQRSLVLSLFCKKCKAFFRKDLTAFTEDDEFCPHCDNQFVIAATYQDYDEGAALAAAAQRVEETAAARLVANHTSLGFEEEI
jgi:uncharacterized CHY-type Zn-finger protein|tara:strand:+ start:65 stop:640 length:576 start_codon:yes stop_codon:yes gene_type:complete